MISQHADLMLISSMRDRKLPPRVNRILPSSAFLRGIRWFQTNVSGLPIRPTFKGQAVQEALDL